MALSSTQLKRIPKKPQPPESFLKALEKIQSKGFSHIKIELEARLGRSDGADIYCDDCNRTGWLQCEACNHSGFNLVNASPVECRECHGDGSNECRRCNGRGFVRGGYSDRWCRDFIIGHVNKATAKAIQYSEFYWDGSVDSEYTVTIPILNGAMGLDFIQAFNALGAKIGHGVDIDNAGLHISVLPDGVYPCKRGLLKPEFMANFRREVAKLLPALYFLGTHTQYTRGLDFRMPYVSNTQKYSAIFTHGDTAIEYRLFDPCFDKPEAFYDKVEIIAATLKYYSNDKVKSSYEKFNMYDLTTLSDMYATTENYDALLKTVKEVKPSKSFTAIKNERGFHLSKSKILQRFKIERAEYEANKQLDYQASLARWEKLLEEFNTWVVESFLQQPPTTRDDRLRLWMNNNRIYDSMLETDKNLRIRMIRDNYGVFGLATQPPEEPERETFEQYRARTEMRPAYVITPGKTVDEESEDEDYHED